MYVHQCKLIVIVYWVRKPQSARRYNVSMLVHKEIFQWIYVIKIYRESNKYFNMHAIDTKLKVAVIVAATTQRAFLQREYCELCIYR